MARLEVSGIDELDRAFRALGNVPDNVVEAACLAGAEIAADKIRQSGESKKIRSDIPPHILDKIKIGKFKRTVSGGYAYITFSGTQKKTKGSKSVKNALIAFENEYGNNHQQARPFVRPAIASGENAIVDAMADKLGDWIERTFNND